MSRNSYLYFKSQTTKTSKEWYEEGRTVERVLSGNASEFLPVQRFDFASKVTELETRNTVTISKWKKLCLSNF
eukprot:2858014-Rhodomonas_salina.3